MRQDERKFALSIWFYGISTLVSYSMPNLVHIYIYIYIEMIGCGECDNKIEICGKLDKSNIIIIMSCRQHGYP